MVIFTKIIGATVFALAMHWLGKTFYHCNAILSRAGGHSDGAQNFGQFLGLSGRRQKEEVAKVKDVKFYNCKTKSCMYLSRKATVTEWTKELNFSRTVWTFERCISAKFLTCYSEVPNKRAGKLCSVLSLKRVLVY